MPDIQPPSSFDPIADHALFEILEIASTAIHAAHTASPSDDAAASVPVLFAFCEMFKDHLTAQHRVSGDWSPGADLTLKWLSTASRAQKAQPTLN